MSFIAPARSFCRLRVGFGPGGAILSVAMQIMYTIVSSLGKLNVLVMTDSARATTSLLLRCDFSTVTLRCCYGCCGYNMATTVILMLLFILALLVVGMMIHAAIVKYVVTCLNYKTWDPNLRAPCLLRGKAH